MAMLKGFKVLSPLLFSEMKIQILVVDDHEIVRKGICRLIEAHEGWQVCGEAANGKQAIEKALELTPDVVLMDISMPLMSGLEATRHIRKRFPSMKIAIISLHESHHVMAEARNAGADAYLLKSDPSCELERTISGLVMTIPKGAADRPGAPVSAEAASAD
ncbi:MAG TPA: response regulator transcription factor [Candidatus Acidoferrales bacterium]|jgi:DNA-binding NarL/FixJ family response regulator|nr:response regulator transcription factor [Candidatus Acidoferrales bacterium]